MAMHESDSHDSWLREIEAENERIREAGHRRALRRAVAHAEGQRLEAARRAALVELRVLDPRENSSGAR